MCNMCDDHFVLLTFIIFFPLSSITCHSMHNYLYSYGAVPLQVGVEIAPLH